MNVPRRLVQVSLMLAILATFLWLNMSGPGTASEPPPQQASPEAQDAFLANYDVATSREFRKLPRQERITFYENTLSEAREQSLPFPEWVQDCAAYLVTELAKEHLQVHAATASLRELELGREAFPECSADWRGAIHLAEASALQQAGALDLAERHLFQAVQLVDEARARQSNVNVGGYFNAHAAWIRFEILVKRHALALRECEEFDNETTWAWMEATYARNGETRTQSNRARLQLLRGQALAGLDTDEAKEQALATFAGIESMPNTPAPTLFEACASQLSILRDENPQADLGGLIVRMDQYFARFSHELGDGLLQQLILDTARLHNLEGAERQASIDQLRACMDRYLEFRRKNTLPAGMAASRYSQYRSALELLLLDADESERLPLLLQMQAAGRLWTALGKPTPVCDEVVRLLCAQGGGILVFSAGQVNSHWITVNAAGETRTFKIPSIRDLRQELMSYEARLRSPPQLEQSEVEKTLATWEAGRRTRLASQIFPRELAQTLRAWSTVSFVGREDLLGLSIESLPLNDGVPFGCSHAIVDIPALAIVPELVRRADRSSGKHGVRIVADSIIAPQVAEQNGLARSLDLSAASIREGLNLGPDSGATILLHADATQDALRDSFNEPILHVIVHGLVDYYRDLSILLAMTPTADSPSGLVDVEFIRATNSAPLVLLSVCSSAGSASRSGDAGANHLGGAFIEAGAHSVVLSPGEVQLDATIAFHRAFYAALRDGASSAEATRRGRVALWKSDEFSAPFHWGQIRLFGIGR